MSFLTVTMAKDVEALKGSGLVGLSPSPAKAIDLLQPMTHGVPGFVAQLKKSSVYTNSYDKMFSLYLSNDDQVPGKITFGGYDVEKFGKKGLKDKDVTWMDQSRNEQYWGANNRGVKIGDKYITYDNQQVIFDNGMSFAMAPQRGFVKLVCKGCL